MTESETKAMKWMHDVKDNAVVVLDDIRNKSNVSPMLYEGRKERAETIIKGFEELEQYRSIKGIKTLLEYQEAKSKREPKEPRICNMALYCSECDERLEAWHKFCPECGQAILRK